MQQNDSLADGQPAAIVAGTAIGSLALTQPSSSHDMKWFDTWSLQWASRCRWLPGITYPDSRRRDCHFTDIPSPPLLKTPIIWRGWVQPNDRTLAGG